MMVELHFSCGFGKIEMFFRREIKSIFSQRNNNMEQALAIATTLSNQLDLATLRIKELQAELKESREYADRLSRTKKIWKQRAQEAESKLLETTTTTAREEAEKVLEDAAEKYSATGSVEDYYKLMEFQRIYNEMYDE